MIFQECDEMFNRIFKHKKTEKTFQITKSYEAKYVSERPEEYEVYVQVTPKVLIIEPVTVDF